MSKITREEVLKIGAKLKPILQNRIEYIDNLQEIDCFSKDSREWKEAKDVLKIINFINQPPQLDSNIEEVIHRLETFKDSQVIYGGEWGELQDAINIIQALNDELKQYEDVNKIDLIELENWIGGLIHYHNNIDKMADLSKYQKYGQELLDLLKQIQGKE